MATLHHNQKNIKVMSTCIGSGECLIQDEECEYILPNLPCEYHCTPKACPNFEFCGIKLPEWLFECHGGVCTHFAVTRYSRLGRSNEVLKFMDTREPCLHCGKFYGRCVKMHECDHWYCTKCFDLILHGSPSDRLHLDPRGFGCRPCMHTPSCQSRPCCDEDDDVLLKWEQEMPQCYEQWNKLESDLNDMPRGIGRCFMCEKA